MSEKQQHRAAAPAAPAWSATLPHWAQQRQAGNFAHERRGLSLPRLRRRRREPSRQSESGSSAASPKR